MSYTQLYYHIVFTPRNRAPVIDLQQENRLYAYIRGFIRNKKGVMYAIGGMPDHIHLLVQLLPMVSVSDFVHDLKLATHQFMIQHRDAFPLFAGWERSFGAFSCSYKEREKVSNYIRHQKEHHLSVSTQDEFRIMICADGLAYNE